MLCPVVFFTPLLFTGFLAVPISEFNRELSEAEETLRAAKVGADGTSVLGFFRQHTPPEADWLGLVVAVRDLGSDSFDLREKASQKLAQAGLVARPFLLPALKDPDPEVSHRAERCLRSIERGPPPDLVLAAVRVLAARRPANTLQALLAYLPVVDDASVEEAVLTALAAVGITKDEADPALVKALTDKAPARRAASARLLGKAVPAQRIAVRSLLTDPEVQVRFQAASTLVRAGDKLAVPVLIALLAEGPPSLAWQAEDLLCRVAGEVSIPATLMGEDRPDRRRCRAAWEDWWKVNAATADLAKVGPEEPLRGLYLVADNKMSPSGARCRGRIWACGRDGKLCWEIDGGHHPQDVHLLPGGRVLTAGEIGIGGGHRVTERDFRNRILWEYKVSDRLICCQRLPNGNTFIAIQHELLEVTRAGQVVSSIPWREFPHLESAKKLSNGHILCAHFDGLVEFDAAGKEVRRIRVEGKQGGGKAEPLPNGNYLVAQYNANQVVEVDATGKILWRHTIEAPLGATRLRNGHVLIYDVGHNLVELDGRGKEVWRLVTEEKVYCARRY
jgi:hypothetical protein